MIIVLKANPNMDEYNKFKETLNNQGIEIQENIGSDRMVLCLLGDTSNLDVDRIVALDIVDSVKRIQEPFKKANRKVHPEDTVISLPGVDIGGGKLTVIAGPCSIETEEQIVAVAKAVKAAGANILRGGAFKPRTSPYSFQGTGKEGLELLRIAKQETGLPIITEIMDSSQLPLFDDVDIIQVGTRNMQNFSLLKELGQQQKPVLLKRGMNATYEEWLMSAEYIMANGNENVILCERGVRTFEPYTRNTLDLSAVPAIKRLSHLPILVDPSHATGKAPLVPPMSLAAVAAGADGVMVEVHNNPEQAWCDGNQSIDPKVFEDLNKKMMAMHELISK